MKDKLVALDPELLFADGYDDCIMGLTFKDGVAVVIYSADLMIEKLCEEMTEKEAQEFFDFNIYGAYVGERTPVYWYGL